jgi:predicted neutral ceramidase superfamily lipid hydrolase
MTQTSVASSNIINFVTPSLIILLFEKLLYLFVCTHFVVVTASKQQMYGLNK